MIRRDKQYDFYECKYFDRPMTLEECCQEKEQLDNIKGITLSGVGFVCTGGFASDAVGRFPYVGHVHIINTVAQKEIKTAVFLWVLQLA